MFVTSKYDYSRSFFFQKKKKNSERQFNPYQLSHYVKPIGPPGGSAACSEVSFVIAHLIKLRNLTLNQEQPQEECV